jgi:hypothetical protein
MLAELTGLASMSYGLCIGELELTKGALEGVTAGMPETLMPQISGGRAGQQCLRGRGPKGIQRRHCYIGASPSELVDP